MRKLIFIALLFFVQYFSFAQEQAWGWLYDATKGKSNTKKTEIPKVYEKNEMVVVNEIINGDTIPVIYLPDLVVMDNDYKKKYDHHLYYIKRMLPYARLAAKIQHDYDSTLAEMEKRRMRKDFLGEQKDIAWAQFEEKIMKMSLEDGRHLMKLIHRETGSVAYDIIIKYLSTPKTFLLQAASRLGGADLKLEYDPEGEDKIMEDIMKKVDKGEIKIKKLTLDPDAVAKKEAKEQEEKLKKKEEKKNKKSAPKK